MKKVILCLAFVGFVACEDIVRNSSISSLTEFQKSSNTTTKTEEQTKEGKINSLDTPRDSSADEGSISNPFDEVNLATDDESLSNFKYYFLILVVSSLSVISIIIFKTLRLVLSVSQQNRGKRFIAF